MRRFPPERIVCLTEETVETLYLLGEEDRIVGVSGYAVRPARVRKEKPRVSAFTSADLPKILALQPDLVLAFSDMQAEIVADLARVGISVHLFNQRDVAGCLAMIRTVGALVGVSEKADALAQDTSSAWLTYGEAAYQDGWFAEAVAAFNRYNQRQIVVADPSLAQEKLVGLFKLDKPENFAAMLGESLDLDVTVAPEQIRLARKKSPER
jgi:hypothetical protein